MANAIAKAGAAVPRPGLYRRFRDWDDGVYFRFLGWLGSARCRAMDLADRTYFRLMDWVDGAGGPRR